MEKWKKKTHTADTLRQKHDCSVHAICELGRFPMYIERYCRMLRYWFKLLCTDNCILKCVYEDMYESSVVKPNDKLNWAYRVRDILFKYVFIISRYLSMLTM